MTCRCFILILLENGNVWSLNKKWSLVCNYLVHFTLGTPILRQVRLLREIDGARGPYLWGRVCELFVSSVPSSFITFFCPPKIVFYVSVCCGSRLLFGHRRALRVKSLLALEWHFDWWFVYDVIKMVIMQFRAWSSACHVMLPYQISRHLDQWLRSY